MIDGIVFGLFGLLIGSFLNVCIHRWPRDLSVVRPRSACPGCGRQISWYDNIPVLSYFLLRRRCRHCGATISWRYPAVELITALIFAFFAFQHGITLETAKECLFAAMLIALIFTDLETYLLPDELTLGGAVIGLALAPLIPVPDTTFHLIAGLSGFDLGPKMGSLSEALFGALVPAGIFWFVGWAFEKIRHKQGLGLGDVKMLAMIGAFLGIKGALLSLFLAAVFGSIAGLAFIRLANKDWSSYHLPLGSFLGMAALAAAAEGQNMIGWYTRRLP